MRRTLAIILSTVMMATTLSVTAAAAQEGTGDTMLNNLNVKIMPIDDNYSSTNFIQVTFTPDNGEETIKLQSCSGKAAAASFMFVPSGTVTFNKKGYHTEPASWHVDADNFDGQTLQFTLIPDNYTGDRRAAAKPEVSITKTDLDEYRNFIAPQDLLTFSTSTPDAVIRYTTDGSEPNYESPRYTRPIYLKEDVTFKAIATKAGYVKSPVMEYHYKAGTSTTPENTAPPETEESRNKVTLYFMTGSSPSDPGEVFAQYEVAENSRGNTTTLAKTVGSSKPEKEGYTFSHWLERSLNDPSKLGNKVTGVIWTNETDQYIYAQYNEKKAEEKVTLYFMTGSSPSDPGEVFAQYEVPKNSRRNTTTIAKTVGSSKPEKEGYIFSHWVEAKLNDSSKLGNKVTGVIWTNETDQYIYAQYKSEDK